MPTLIPFIPGGRELCLPSRPRFPVEVVFSSGVLVAFRDSPAEPFYFLYWALN